MPAELKQLASIKIPNATIEYYDIFASNAFDIRNQMDLLGPVDSRGHKCVAATRWSIHWNWPGRGKPICILSKATVSYDIKVILPRWNPLGNVRPELIESWTTFIHKVVQHEQGHVEFVVVEIPAILDVIRNSSCESADEEASKILEEINHNNLQYDFGNGVIIFP